MKRRASAFGLFTAGYGLFWFLGSATIGFLYDLSVPAMIAFCVTLNSPALPIFIWVSRQANVVDHA